MSNMQSIDMLLLFDNSTISPTPPSGNFLLLENGGKILLESGGGILLENSP